MSEIAISKSPDLLVTLGLGSCVGVCIYDSFLKLGGMAHIMLPDSSAAKEVINKGKFADTAIPALVKQMEESGSVKTRMVVKIAGGAQMFSYSGMNNKMLVGPRNIAAVENSLNALGLRISGKSVGGNLGRSINMDLSTGVVKVRMLNSPEIIL
jgi:chemotaxis protein CheD